MKQDRIAKLYERLTNKERAALAFRYMTDINELELERVAAAVPMKTYQCPDMEYQRWLDGFACMAALWAIEHWQTFSRKLAALGAMHIMIARKEPEKAQAMIEAHEKWESRLLALDRALLAICEEHGLDPDAVRRMAGADPFTPLYALEPDAEYQETMQASLSRLLERRPEVGKAGVSGTVQAVGLRHCLPGGDEAVGASKQIPPGASARLPEPGALVIPQRWGIHRQVKQRDVVGHGGGEDGRHDVRR